MSGTMAIGTFVGRLTRDAELKYTQSGVAVLGFSIATDRREKDQASGEYKDHPSFWDCTLFGKAGEAVQQYMTKGKQVAVNGELTIDQWEQDGQKRTKVKVYVDKVTLLGGGERQEGKPAQANDRQPAKAAEFTDDMPF